MLPQRALLRTLIPRLLSPLPIPPSPAAGVALRVPTPTVSVVDLVVQVEKKTFAEEVNEAFREAANGPMKGVLGVSDEPLVRPCSLLLPCNWVG